MRMTTPSPEPITTYAKDVVHHVKTVLLRISRDLGSETSDTFPGNQLQRLTVLHSNLVQFEADGVISEVVKKVKAALDTLQLCESVSCLSYQAPTCTYSGKWGKPRYAIERAQLEFLVRKHFSIPNIAILLRESESTVKRRLEECGISIRSSYADITNDELDDIVTEIKLHFPNAGIRTMIGHLESKGIHIQEVHVRESMHRVDPEGIIERWLRLKPVQRRKYQVRSPLSLGTLMETIS